MQREGSKRWFPLKFISKFYRTHFRDLKEEFNISSFALNLLKLANNLLPQSFYVYKNVYVCLCVSYYLLNPAQLCHKAKRMVNFFTELTMNDLLKSI